MQQLALLRPDRSVEDGPLKIEFDVREIRAFLLRHLSPHDSFSLSGHMATTMELWKAHGQEQLRTLMVNLGVSKEHQRSRWYSLDKSLRDRIVDRIADPKLRVADPTFVTCTLR